MYVFTYNFSFKSYFTTGCGGTPCSPSYSEAEVGISLESSLDNIERPHLKKKRLDIVTYTCFPSYQEAEARGCELQVSMGCTVSPKPA
jgi:hypothetical protein